MTDIVIVLTTVADDERAEPFARELVDQGLAACVNLYPPMVSVYRWKGRIERETERQVVIKTTRARLNVLEAKLKSLHAYELPEFAVISIDSGSEAYLNWVRDQVESSAK